VRPAEATVTADRRNVSVLIVDDNRGKRLALRAILFPLGYTIVEADSGTSALRCLLVQDFAVILLDVRMPGMDGFETAALIRQRAQSEMTPIIFITAFERDQIDKSDRYAQGAVDFIFAPVSPEELRAKVSVFANLYIKAQLLAAKALELQTSADRLRLLTETAPIGIFQTDAENRYVYTNPQWSQITGLTAEAAAGQGWDVIVAPEQRARLLHEVPDGASEQDAELCHHFQIQTSAAPRIVLFTSKVLRDHDGTIEGWVGTLADVTAEAGAKAAMAEARDQATEASRLKSDFLANMSHEIRTPMNGVIGMADLLLVTRLDARQREYAQTVRNSGEALLVIIDDILDFSKVEAGKLEVEDVLFSPVTVTEDVLDLLAPSAQAKGLEVIANVDADVPGAINGDPGRLRQVLTNLVGNAIKFTRTGEIVVRVQSSECPDQRPGVRFAVSDTGDGVAADKLDMIFKPFVQADTSTTRLYGGTGLGLAISSKLVGLMGGECGVSSRLGVGSTFWFTIRGQAQLASESNEDRPDARLNGCTALIVDDSRTQCDVLSGYLTAWGMQVQTAGSGAAALACLRAAAAAECPIGLAVVDGSMPEMGGLELLALMHTDAVPGAPAVLMMGLGAEPDLGHREAAEPAAIISKPIRQWALHSAILLALGMVFKAPTPSPSLPGDSPDPLGTLLLAEDNLINQKVAVAMLSGAGYQVDTALDGIEAVQAASTCAYDAILMDCQMSRLNGYEATAAIRAQEAGGRRTPIIAMTAGAMGQDRARCLAEDMDAYVAKPVSRDVLLALVAQSIADAHKSSLAIAASAPA